MKTIHASKPPTQVGDPCGPEGRDRGGVGQKKSQDFPTLGCGLHPMLSLLCPSPSPSLFRTHSVAIVNEDGMAHAHKRDLSRNSVREGGGKLFFSLSFAQRHGDQKE
ncbi:hypothetical protein CDAR_320701 [Caerostris darwini]|uniref:Uncharacterized protein n=1 Tax=Caerostris darwini TaxID=1538125 RepID=A0AAV4X0S3_9ARAC|nr:hypothetical protein CDAR_320701 [Caerostris darwini]